MKYRRALVEDARSLANLFNDYRLFYGQESDLIGAEKFLKARLEREESVVYYAYESNGDVVEPVGFTQLYPSFSSVSMKRVWILNDLFVAKRARRKGVAQGLIEKARDLAVETEAKAVTLETDHDNHNAQNLYEKIGFTKDTQHHYTLNVPR
ncbi:GNAT family N-acetyltransferase [Bacillus pakistanensis]|uniref:GNAT family N-acetyltransferase n=1 Tax=Rossellomorea pakistanensis TaxID=992288 RepID=UPI00196244D0